MNPEWRSCKLGDVITLKRGYDLPNHERKPGPFPVVSSSGVTDHHAEAKVTGPGVVTGRYGTLGQVFLIVGDFWPLNTSLYVNDFKGNDPRFVSYLLRTLNFATQNAAGAVPGVNRNHLHAMNVSVPDLPEQRRIAGILSAYDDLIENCERRIRVLEEMARALYREWFVLFRYPGHEKTPLVDSALGRIPRGWRCSDVASVSDGPEGVQTGPFGSQLHQEEYAREGIPLVMPKDLRGFRIDEGDIARVPEEVADRVSRHRMKVGDIVYGRRGDIGRRAFVMEHQVGTICGTGCLRIRPNSRAVDGWYLFNYLGQENVVTLISGRAQGVTMPNLNTKLLATVPIIVPPRALQDEFAARTFQLAVQRERLFAMMRNLAQTRDLLLPRLLSGQLSIEDAA